MGRKKVPDVKNVSLRLNGSTERQLRAEAKAKGWTLGTYVRQLLQAYAPGVDKAHTEKMSAAARQLSEL